MINIESDSVNHDNFEMKINITKSMDGKVNSKSSTRAEQYVIEDNPGIFDLKLTKEHISILDQKDTPYVKAKFKLRNLNFSSRRSPIFTTTPQSLELRNDGPDNSGNFEKLSGEYSEFDEPDTAPINPVYDKIIVNEPHIAVRINHKSSRSSLSHLPSLKKPSNKF